MTRTGPALHLLTICAVLVAVFLSLAVRAFARERCGLASGDPRPATP